MLLYTRRCAHHRRRRHPYQHHPCG
jgi:hypothetical protein